MTLIVTIEETKRFVYKSTGKFTSFTRRSLCKNIPDTDNDKEKQEDKDKRKCKQEENCQGKQEDKDKEKREDKDI